MFRYRGWGIRLNKTTRDNFGSLIFLSRASNGECEISEFSKADWLTIYKRIEVYFMAYVNTVGHTTNGETNVVRTPETVEAF